MDEPLPPVNEEESYPPSFHTCPSELSISSSQFNTCASESDNTQRGSHDFPPVDSGTRDANETQPLLLSEGSNENIPENQEIRETSVIPAIEHHNSSRGLEIEVTVPQDYLSQLSIILIGVYGFCGTSFTSAPYAVRDGGWMSLFAVPLFSIAAYLNATLLRFCFGTGINSYEDIGNAAFPVFGRQTISVLLCILSLTTSISAVMIEKDNLEYMFPRTLNVGLISTTLGFLLMIVIVMAVLIILCVFVVREENPWISGLGVIFITIVLSCLVLNGFFHVGFHGEATTLFNASTMHFTVGFFSYSFAGHAYMPMLYRMMSNKGRYRSTVLIIFLITTLLYGGAASVGYAMYGDAVKPMFTLNMKKNLMLSQLAIWSSILDHIVRYTLNIAPVTYYFDKVIPQNLSMGRRLLYKILFRVLLVLFTIVASTLDKFYVELISFSGATVGVLVSMIVPAACFLRIKRTTTTRIERTYGWMAIVFGFGAATFTIVKGVMTTSWEDALG